jgi:hypothetical protein
MRSGRQDLGRVYHILEPLQQQLEENWHLRRRMSALHRRRRLPGG